MFIVEQIKATEVELGDLIRSRDVEGKADRYRLVTNKMFPIVEDQVEISANGYSVCTSSTHPIAYLNSDNKELYKETDKIESGDAIITPDGYAYVGEIRKGILYDTNFIDYTVDEDNNYYAGNEKGRLILAHNSATLYFPFFHLEIENMLVLKNNKGVEDNRVRHMDYGVQFNKLFYERVLTGGDITLFSPNDVTEMYEAFFSDYDRFKELYETAERNTRIRKKKLPAVELFSMFVQERKETGRIYLQNVDNVNTHSAFDEKVAPVRMSNLCCEINLNTTPMGTTKIETKTLKVDDLADFMQSLGEKTMKVLNTNALAVTVETTEDLSRIALCTLSAVNWGVVKDTSEFERIGRLAVRALDNLLDYQEYPIFAARKHTQEYRPLGVGIINFAYFLAKNGVKYSDGSALPLVDEWAEAWSYALIKASMELAKERGPCHLHKNTKYSKGIVPIDTRKLAVDELISHQERMDWNGLREDLRSYGIRNATLMALMPSETSSQLSNATNGIEPPRSYVSVKQSKHGVLKQVVPEFRKLKSKYELLWDQESPEGYLHLCAVLQKYIDMGISVNTTYNQRFYPEEQLPISILMRDILQFYKMGGKQLYYFNTNDGAGEVDVDAAIAQGRKEVEDAEAVALRQLERISEVIHEYEEETCDSCVL